MKQHRQRNGQEGIAMIIVVCIMAVLVMMSLALLLASSVMTQNAGRVKDQEQSRILAVSLADELEKELQGNDFIRIHQSYLVNMKHIEKVSRYEALLNNGIKLEIPKARYKFVEETFVSYKGEI